MQPPAFQNNILNWFDRNGRKDLPWQNNMTPYRVWVSEIMLQQTQVATVIPYYLRFMQHFPEVNSLAEAELDAVLCLWSGLGYYARARNLHKAARIIAKQKHFPNSLDELQRLPGIGRSTAGAILSIAFHQSHAILDGNVKRVLARYHAINGWPGLAAVNKQLWCLSKQYTPQARVADYTQAMMDLGATVCIRAQPQCGACPVADGCRAYKENRTAQLPGKKASRQLPVKHCVFMLLTDPEQGILLQQRPVAGIWGGLWSLPEFNDTDAVLSWCLEKNIRHGPTRTLAMQRHTFSHYHLDYSTVMLQMQNTGYQVMEANRTIWYKADQISKLGLPVPIKRLLQTLFYNNEGD